MANYEEKFLIYYNGSIVGSLLYCDFDKKWWVKILNDTIRTKFYKDNRKFARYNLRTKKNGTIVIKEQHNFLAEELVKLWELEKQTANYEECIYCRVLVEDVFDRVYSQKVNNKEILDDIKKEFPDLFVGYPQKILKKSIIKIFQNQNLKLKINGKI